MSTENTIAEDLLIRVVHLHPGNSSKRDRKGSKYMTIAKLIGGTKEEPVELARGYARCNEYDAPSRKVGREVAIGRALKAMSTGAKQLPETFHPKHVDTMTATLSTIKEMIRVKEMLENKRTEARKPHGLYTG